MVLSLRGSRESKEALEGEQRCSPGDLGALPQTSAKCKVEDRR